MARRAQTRRFALQMTPTMYDDLRAVANGKGLTAASYGRSAIAAALQADALAAPQRTSDRGVHLTGEDVLRLDAALRELGVDLAKV